MNDDCIPSNSARDLRGGPFNNSPVDPLAGETGRKVGVPSDVVDTIGRKNKLHFSNS